MTNFEDVLATVTKLLVQYEEGDALLLSDIQDAIQSLRVFIQPNAENSCLLDFLSCQITDYLKGNINLELINQLSEGLDLLQSYHVEVIETKREKNLNKIQQFLNQHRKLIEISKPAAFKASLQSEILLDQLPTFLMEAQERFQRAQELILDLERTGTTEGLQELFRIFHTIKGECGFLKIPLLAGLTHKIESLLDRLRSNQKKLDQGSIDKLLQGLDLCLEIWNYLSTQNREPDWDSKVQAFSVESSENLKESVLIKSETLKADKPDKTSVSDPYVRVKTSKVNNLVEVLGELVIALGQTNDTQLSQVKKITRELQQTAMELRTDSVKALMGNMKRAVRDLAQKLNKEIEVVTAGEDLEIDRDLIEKLEEPLIHLIRNSADHGIQKKGTINLTALRRGNRIEIIVRDDGQGLNCQKILSKALEKGLITSDQAANMGRQEIFALIFRSGFSTADQVSQVSGRGVGMEIVNSVVSLARGRVEVASEEGQYTQFSLVFPLSTAIIEGILVRCKEKLYVLPLQSVVESLKIQNEKIDTLAGTAKMYNLRGTPLPLVGLEGVLSNKQESGCPMGVVVEGSDRKKYVLGVDEILTKREVVIKSLGPQFKNLQGISAGAVVSGGSVALVLDIDQIVALGARGGAA